MNISIIPTLQMRYTEAQHGKRQRPYRRSITMALDGGRARLAGAGIINGASVSSLPASECPRSRFMVIAFLTG